MDVVCISQNARGFNDLYFYINLSTLGGSIALTSNFDLRTESTLYVLMYKVNATTMQINTVLGDLQYKFYG